MQKEIEVFNFFAALSGSNLIKEDNIIEDDCIIFLDNKKGNTLQIGIDIYKENNEVYVFFITVNPNEIMRKLINALIEKCNDAGIDLEDWSENKLQGVINN